QARSETADLLRRDLATQLPNPRDEWLDPTIEHDGGVHDIRLHTVGVSRIPGMARGRADAPHTSAASSRRVLRPPFAYAAARNAHAVEPMVIVTTNESARV